MRKLRLRRYINCPTHLISQNISLYMEYPTLDPYSLSESVFQSYWNKWLQSRWLKVPEIHDSSGGQRVEVKALTF